MMADLLASRLPDGVFSVIQGDKAVDAILENQSISAVSFVGSPRLHTIFMKRGGKRQTCPDLRRCEKSYDGYANADLIRRSMRLLALPMAQLANAAWQYRLRFWLAMLR